MIKLLVGSDILLGALKGEKAPLELLERGKKDTSIQLWSLANALEKLLKLEQESEKLKVMLKGISQIPINAQLNTQAISSSLEFNNALLAEAAVTFKIDYIVTSKDFLSSNEVPVVNCDRVLSVLKEPETVRKVDFMNLNLGLHPVLDQIDGWYTDIIQNTAFAGGNHVNEFEKEFAAFCGTDFAVGVNSGTDALRFALIAMKIGAEDEVITVPHTFIATSEVITQVGAKIVFVDVRDDTYTIDPNKIEKAITKRTKAIVPVHLYGQVVDMEQIMEIAEKYNLQVLEDACQAHGAIYKGKRAGSLGHAAAFSMYPGKNLGAFGEAGCIVTNDKQIDEICRCLRDHGQYKKYHHSMEGYNGRMDNLQAAALRAKLPYLDSWNARRRELARFYINQLDSVDQVKLPAVLDYDSHVFHVFMILVPDPQKLSEYLKSKNIFTAFHYPVPLHLQPAYQARGEKKGDFPVTEDCAQHLISLPMFPELTNKQAEYVCNEIKEFFAKES